MLKITENVAIVLPPFINIQEHDDLPKHKRDKIYLNKRTELFCLYFGTLKRFVRETVFHVKS